ncbi:DNA methyltransferase [Neobacillus drentensis]|uniref:DNA methyltransferase n=1 Tax=Neobacillus drentensis TaxID=220684 RepID=UPI0028603D36|nr:DNA methyltransferase [Neobacillus drentensis]MDR7239659.1 hypothetical protein [Neobacillus drentensis]
MMNLEKLQSDVKEIGADNGPDFIYRFLLSYGMPKATIARLRLNITGEEQSPVHVPNKIYYQFTSKSNLLSLFNLLKRDNLNKIKARFICIANKDNILAYDMNTEETLLSSKKELYKSFDFFFPLIGREKKVITSHVTVNIKAAERFAELYNELVIANKGTNDVDKIVSNLMSRLLFCFFADSVGLISRGAINKIVYNFSEESGTNLSYLLESMFKAFFIKDRNGVPDYLMELPFLDIHMFNTPIELPRFNKRTRKLILEISELDWSDVNPDILGSLIQSIVSTDKNNINYNFTSVPNIYKLIGPLFLDELYEAYESSKNEYQECLNLLNRISKIKIFDPACFTGNFLIVIYKELKELESKIVESMRNLPNSKEVITSSLNISQFYGIEKNEFACIVTRLGLFFTECQISILQNGRLTFVDHLLEDLNRNNIIHGNATRISWNDICPNSDNEIYVVGNPPYKGARKQSKEQKDDVEFVFRNHNNIKDMDYAACWFYLASKFVGNSKNAFAFVTTNSLTQGQLVGLLWPKIFDENVHISFAHTEFKWKNSGKNNTAVTVVIIGIRSDVSPKRKFIFTQTTAYEVPWINPYLTAPKVIVKKQRKPISNLPPMPKGNMPYDKGHLLLEPHEVQELVNQYPTSKKFLKRVMGSDEFINDLERWCIWIDDKDLNEALLIPPIKDRINHVKKFRLNKLAKPPHQFRETNITKTYSLIIPSVSSERRTYIPIGFVNENTIITNLAFSIYDCDPWVFGVISSKMHNLWVRTVCGRLESRIRYSSQLGYNTFPFPDISNSQKESIKRCVYDIITERENQSEKSIAQMYDPDNMSEGLLYTHMILDANIERCYREEPFHSDQERLEFLFDLYNRKGD